MIYQLGSAKEIIARIDNNFSIDYSDWIPRTPLWIADAMDQMQLVSLYEEKYIDISIVDYIVSLPDDTPQDIRRILGVFHDGFKLNRLNKINAIQEPSFNAQLDGSNTYTIKNGYIVTSLEDGIARVYYQALPIEYDPELLVYFPRVPMNSIVQGAIEWYIIYSILKRGHKHPIFSLDSKNPITNPYSMWIQESKKGRNQVSALDSEERSQMSQLIRTFIVNLNLPISDTFREEATLHLKNSITGQTGLV
jgi:glycosidase